LKLNGITIFGLIFVLGLVFRKGVLPEMLAKESPKMLKIPKCSDSIDSTKALTIFTCRFDAKTSQMHLNTSPTCFEGTRGRKIRFRDPGTKIWFGGTA